MNAGLLSDLASGGGSWQLLGSHVGVWESVTVTHAVKRPALGPARAIVVATTALVLINAVAIGLQSPPAGGAAVRALRHLFDAGQHLALGLLLAAVVAALQRVGLGRRGAVIAVGVAATSLAIPLLTSDVSNFAWRVAPSFPKVVHGAVGVGVGVSFSAAVWLGTVPQMPLLRAGLAIVGLVALAANHVLLPADYAGVHLVVTLMGIAVIAAALSRATLPRGWPVVVRVTPWALASSLAAFCVGVWPGTPVVMEILRSDGSVVMPLLARVHAARTRTEAPIPVHSRAWFQPRAAAPPVPPSRVVRLPGPPVVLLLSIDGLRADVVLEGKHDAHMPFLAKLRDGALTFDQARTPGAQTVYTMSSLFSCVYFSQLYWSKHRGNIWPAADETPRFPELLTRARVRTFNVTPAPWLVNDIGVVRGFAEEVHTPPPRGTKYTPAVAITDAFIAQLSKLGDGPAFGFTHYLDTHDGMRRRAAGDTPFEKHLSQLKLVDGELARIDAAVKARGLSERTVLIVTSDHGEGFGQRGVKGHSAHLYDELLRVPLFVRTPTPSAKRVDTPVSVIDLGPTILDLFGLPTPGHCMGETLARFTSKEPPKLTRPIAAEGRQKKMLLLQDRYKVILDDRVNTEEVYDLRSDPKEERNLIAHDEVNAASWVSLARQFFDVHTLKRDGYVVPFRR